MASFLSALSGLGRGGGQVATQYQQQAELRKREEELARKQKMDAFFKTFSLLDPKAQMQALQSQTGQSALGDNAGLVRDSLGRQIAEQQQAKIRDEGIAGIGTDIQMQADAPDVPEGSAEALYDAGKTGRGLDAIMGINRTIQSKKDAKMSKRVDEMYDKSVASGDKAKMISTAGQLKTMGFPERGKELMDIAETLPSDGAKLEKVDLDDAIVFVNPFTGEEVKRIEKPNKSGGGKKLGQVQEQKLDAIKTLDAQMDIANSLLDMDDVSESIGPFSGTINRFKQNNPMIGSVAGRPPIAFSTFQSTLVNSADAFLRMRTGAAAQDQEIQRIMNQIVGDVTLEPETLRAMFKTFQRSLEIEKQAIEGGRSEPVDVTTALLELQQIINGQTPKSLASETQNASPDDLESLSIEELRKRALGGQ